MHSAFPYSNDNDLLPTITRTKDILGAISTNTIKDYSDIGKRNRGSLEYMIRLIISDGLAKAREMRAMDKANVPMKTTNAPVPAKRTKPPVPIVKVKAPVPVVRKKAAVPAKVTKKSRM